MSAPPPPRIRTGRIIAQRLYDIAWEIDLARAERLWAGGGARQRLVSTPAKSIDFGVAPLTLALGAVALRLGGGTMQAEATARLYDFGVATLSLAIPAGALAWAEFAARLDQAHAATGPDATDPPWPALLDSLRTGIADALVRPNRAPIEEDFLVGLITSFDTPLTAEELLARVDPSPLLVGAQPHPLAEGARAEILRHRFSWHVDDLVVLGWDRALLVEPRGETDVLDVLEVANAQLLEMRFYDEMLDAELPRMTALVTEARRAAPRLLSGRRYSRLARQLNTLVAEITQQTERVDNALQVTEDVYLARVYAAAMALFRVPAVEAAVARKLQVIRDTYRFLHEEAASARAELLEIAIVLLIVTEILLSLIRH